MNLLFYIKQCASTNDEVLNFINQSTPALTSVYTFNQTKGRGQYGNSWDSPKNKNLSISFAIPIKNVNSSDSLFNFHTALVFSDFLDILTKKEVQIKWPNDIILNGKKVAGILLEKRKHQSQWYYILGIGLNVLHKNFEHLPNASSLSIEVLQDFNLETIAQNLYLYFSEHLFSSCSETEIITKYNTRLFRKNKISVFEIKEMRQNGIIKEVDKKGYLWIDLENEGLQKFYHKEITLLY